MRKLLVAVLALGLVAAMKAPSFAAFASVRISTFTASTTFSGTGSVNMSASLIGGSSLSWSGVTIGTTKWKASDVYVQVHSTITASGGGIQIYTDNRNGTVVAERYSGTGNPAGLVSLSSTTATIPMCWRIVTVSTTSLTIQQGAPGFPDRLWASELGNGYPCFVWMMDTGTAGFLNALDYVTVRDALRGIQHAEATWAATTISPAYIYIGADFTLATTPNTYRTTTLRIEAFTD